MDHAKVDLSAAVPLVGGWQAMCPVLSHVSLAEVVDDVLEAEHLAIGGADISLAADIPPNLMLRADPEQLHRILSNLVKNARQAILGSGEAGEITVTARAEERHWVIKVSDTGPGLPSKARDNLFKAFQGGARKGGSGLGLAIVQELVRGHGGTLDPSATGVLQKKLDQRAGITVAEGAAVSVAITTAALTGATGAPSASPSASPSESPSST